jgi:hypothetical protein
MAKEKRTMKTTMKWLMALGAASLTAAFAVTGLIAGPDGHGDHAKGCQQFQAERLHKQ